MSFPRDMRAVVADAPGAPEVLHVRHVPTPRPRPGEVLLRVAAAAVNFSDVKRRRGDAYPFPTVFPFVPGAEVAGTVVALGDGVEAPVVGTRVVALVGGDGHGGYAEFAVAFASQVVPVPAGLADDVACGLIVAGMTAVLLAGEAAGIGQGESVLVPAPTGAVGHFLIQLALRAGASTVIAATTADADKRRAALAAGAHAVVDCTAADWPERVRDATAARGVDVLFEAAGGDSLRDGLRALAPFGRAVVYGAASGLDAAIDGPTSRALFHDPAPNQRLVAFNVGGWFIERPAAAAAALGDLVAALAAGRIAAPPTRTYPLADAAPVHRLVEARAHRGKLVLDPRRR